MKVEFIEVEKVAAYANNPRHNDLSVDRVAESIKQFGFRVPLLVDAENIIVAGHTRIRAAVKLGLKKVPCIRVTDLSAEQVKALRLADNKAGESSYWNLDKLTEELNGLNLSLPDFKPEDFGFASPGGDIDPDKIWDGLLDGSGVINANTSELSITVRFADRELREEFIRWIQPRSLKPLTAESKTVWFSNVEVEL